MKKSQYIFIFFFYKSVQLFQRPSTFNSSYLRQRCKHYCSSNVNMLIDVDEIFIESQCDNKLHAVNESINRCASVGTHKRLIYYSIAVPSFQLYGIQVQLYENRCYVHGQRVQPSCSGLAFWLKCAKVKIARSGPGMPGQKSNLVRGQGSKVNLSLPSSIFEHRIFLTVHFWEACS